MNLFRRSIELVVIRDIFNPQNNIETYTGYDVELLLKQAFGGNGLSESVRLYHGNLLDEVTPKTPQDVDKVMRLHGRIYAVVKPMGLDPASWIIIGISLLVSVAVAFLMPMPAMPNSGNQPPSPNNALAARTNKQRLGGRIPDIYGQVWSVPDLIAPTYSAYIDNREVEFSYMCVGRGRFNVTEALDDTTPINQVFGSSVYVYDPDDSLNDTPDFLFGSAMTPDEAALSRLAVKRYTSVNGQVLPPADNYVTLDKAVFRAGGIIEQSGVNFVSQFTVGENLTIVQANPAESANGITEPVDQGDPPADPPLVGDVVTYSLSGVYVISALTETQVTLSNPATINTDWQKLADNADFTVETGATISTKSEAQWQGWFYTASKEHDRALINIRAPQGLYITGKNDFEPIGLDFEIESELVDVTNNPIAGTLERVTRTIYGSKYEKYANYGGNGSFRYGNHWWGGNHISDDEVAQSAGATFEIPNTHMEVGKRLRFRVRRKHNRVEVGDEFSAIQEIRIADFYGARLMTAADAPKGVTTVYTKTLATEGALSLKERKLRLLVQRYVTDATSGLPKLSNRADDILRDIATDPKIGNLQLTQFDVAQIKSEIDAQIAYFGTDKCSEFCGTFDDNNLSAEETMQIVAKAVFSQAKRQGNKIMLDFERKVPASVAVFNSHNILPDTFTAPQSLGIANDYDGVKIEYTDPIDDAIITMTYPNDAITNPHEDKLIGVRNKVQAHTHMMRMYNKDRHAYKSCEFVAGDESNIVVRTNRITVADQLRADVQQGSVDSIETIGGDIVLHTTDPVTIEPTGAYTMFIQTINNGVESIAVTARDDYSVKLARLPSGEISGTDRVVQAVYQIVSETDDNRDAYLVAQKDPSDGMTNKLLCTNYDDRYYQNDKDHIAPPYVFTPLDLFIGGKQGVWYDPSDKSTLFQDVAGTVPVTKDGDPVALMLDKSQGLVLGSELVNNGTFNSDLLGWTASSSVELTRDTSVFESGGAKSTATGTASTYFSQSLGSNFVVGRTYKATALAYTPSTISLNRRAAIGIVNIGLTTKTVFQKNTGIIETISIIFTATSTTHSLYCSIARTDGLAWGAVGDEVIFDSISVKELKGNHATQTVSAARPISQSDNTKSWLYNDKIDDKLHVKLPAMTATVVKASDEGVSINYPVTITAEDYVITSTTALGRDYGHLIINKELSASEVTQVTNYFNAKRGV